MNKKYIHSLGIGGTNYWNIAQTIERSGKFNTLKRANRNNRFAVYEDRETQGKITINWNGPITVTCRNPKGINAIIKNLGDLSNCEFDDK